MHPLRVKSRALSFTGCSGKLQRQLPGALASLEAGPVTAAGHRKEGRTHKSKKNPREKFKNQQPGTLRCGDNQFCACRQAQRAPLLPGRRP